MSKIAIWELYMGINEVILKRDNRRLMQVCHYLKRGFVFLITFGKVRIKLIDYYKPKSGGK